MVGLRPAAAALPLPALRPRTTSTMKHALLPTFLAAALLALGGCAVQRPPARVEPQVAPQWYATLPHGGRLSDLTSWWQQLHDPVLSELIAAAEAASPTVASARSRIEQARSTRTAAKAALLPSLDARASAQRGNTQPPLPLVTILQAGAQASWEVDLFGANRDAERAAQARLEGAQAGWHEARVSVAAETANSYVGLRMCERQVEVAEQDARSRAETARLSRLSAQAGFTAPADAELARASAADASRRLTQQRAQCEIAVKGLVALTALSEPILRDRLASAWAQPPDSAIPPVPAVPAALLEQRPDVYRAEREIAAASAEVGSAQAQRYPQLSLSGSVAASSFRAGGETTSFPAWSIGPVAVTLPLFDAGRRAANVEAASARYAEAVAQYRGQVRQAVREVEEALVQLDSASARRADAQAAYHGYAASLTATQARYESGLASLLELEESRRTALAAQTALVGLQQETLAAWIALYRAVGGGWTAAAPALASRTP
jgi:outer membrane protein, multidrug efflux system